MKQAIEVNNLSKVYEINHDPKASYRSIREEIVKNIKRPVKRLVGRTQVKEEFWALKDITFNVKEGEVIGIIGRNGAGKSTLLKILSRVVYPTKGSATLRGRVASLLEVGTGFHPELTGRENIYFNGALLGMTRLEIHEKFDAIVDFAEIERFLDTPVKHYSSGMYTKLAFAVAAHLNPEILIVDEVLSVGDAQFQRKSLGKMQEAANSGRTVLFVSHNMSSIRQLCSRGIWLENGGIRMEGNIETVVASYLKENVGSTSELDLSNFKSNYGQGEIKVGSIRLINAIGDTFSVPWDKDIELEIEYKSSSKPLQGVSFAVGGMTTDNVPLFTVRSTDSIKSIDIPPNSTGSIKAIINHNLRAGYYNLVIGISSGNDVFYYNPNAAQLEITDIGEKTYNDRNTGIINCQSEWGFR